MQNLQTRNQSPLKAALKVSLLTIFLGACSTSQPVVVDTALRCPALPPELAAEARRKPVIRGDTAVEVAGRLVTQVHAKNAALRDAIAAHEDCRK